MAMWIATRTPDQIKEIDWLPAEFRDAFSRQLEMQQEMQEQMRENQ
jgi:hypothetical protein